MKRLLVFGAGGFIGKRFVESFGGRYDLVPVVSDADGTNPDLSVYGELYPLVAGHRPDAVLNLAGKSYHSPGGDAGIYESNALVELNLHEALARLGLETRTVMCSSSAVYGGSAEPLTEDSPCAPVNSYARAKYIQERVAASYHPGQKVVIARLFNVIGPRQNGNFFIPTLIGRVLEYRDGKNESVELKTLNATRDFVYIDDVCEALGLLIERGRGGEVYNVCTGEGASIERVIDTLRRLLDMPDLPVRARSDRVEEGIDRQVGDRGKIAELGWSPRFDLERSLEAILREEHGR